MIDIWGRPLSSAKPNTETQGIKDVKEIIEDEIAKTLNLVNVDPNEIVVFQDKQGKLKSSNVSLDSLLTKDPKADDNSIVVFKNGKLAPDVLISSITGKLDAVYNTENSLKTLNDKYDTHVTEFKNFIDLQKTNIDEIDKSLTGFFGNPPATEPALTTIKAEIDNLAKLKIEYDAHVTAFTNYSENQKRNLDEIDKLLQNFFGGQLITTPNLAEIQTDINKITKLRTDYDTHVAQFAMLRRNFNNTDNVIEKFFIKKGTNAENKKNIKPEDITTTLEDLVVKFNELKLLGDQLANILKSIAEIRTQIETINKDNIENLKKSVDDSKIITDIIKDDFEKVIETLDKVKIPIIAKNNISNIVYVIKFGEFTWTKDSAETLNFELPSVKGFYRISLINKLPSEGFIPFNIKIETTLNNVIRNGGGGINSVAIFSILDKATNPTNIIATLSNSQGDIVRTSLTYIVEYLSEIV